MGQGYSLGCKRCGYKISANLGVGFAFPRVYEAVMKEAHDGKLGKTVQSFLKEHPEGALDCDQVLLQCDECGALERGMDLSMYILKDAVEPRQKGFWSTAFSGEGYSYVAPWDLKESYSLYARYDHTCKKCKGKMKVIKQKDLELQESRSPDHITSNIPCPKCKTPLSFEGMIMWD